uniref:Non-specific serine/threonine protein kinase n=1 Tax=Heterorhabditis bacteriophora TaxID=37862 RepID=A0A1I7X8R7_HETBA
MVTPDGNSDDPTPQASDKAALTTTNFNKLKLENYYSQDSNMLDSPESLDDNTSSNDDDDETVVTFRQPKMSIPAVTHDDATTVLPGSVMAAYLSDPIVHPAARNLYVGEYSSPRPRAADYVDTLRSQYKTDGAERVKAPCGGYPSTSTFIAMVNDMAGLFEDRGCCPDDETALHCAASRGHMECVQSLLDAGAPVDALDHANKTALHCALERGHLDIAVLLITKGCKINEQDEHGDTALHIAARAGLLSAVQTLCHCGADVDIVNKDSYTPLHLASKEGFIDIVRVLCLARSNIAKKTKDQTREMYIDQLFALDAPLRRIKLKLFGHSLSGKSRLVQALHSTRGITSIIGKIYIYIYYFFKYAVLNDGIHSGQGSSFSSESNNNTGEQWPSLGHKPSHSNYTRGIDVQTVNCAGCGEYSVWEFGGYEPYHMAYDHFVGNTDCIHVIMYRATDSTEDQYKQVLYWMNFLKGRVTPTEPIEFLGATVSFLNKLFIKRNSNVFMRKIIMDILLGEYMSSDTEAMLKTVRLRFETHFDIYDRLILLDSTNPSCPGMKAFKNYLNKTRSIIVSVGMIYLSRIRQITLNFRVRVLPMRGMERSLQSTFPRIQVAMRRSMHDFQVNLLSSFLFLPLLLFCSDILSCSLKNGFNIHFCAYPSL